MKKGMKVDEIHELSYIDKWFISHLKELVDVEQFLLSRSFEQLTKDDFYEVKRRGFSDKQIVYATNTSEREVRSIRSSLGVISTYKRVDTCAAEFEGHTPYMYSSYEFECESAPTQRPKVLILGGETNSVVCCSLCVGNIFKSPVFVYGEMVVVHLLSYITNQLENLLYCLDSAEDLQPSIDDVMHHLRCSCKVFEGECTEGPNHPESTSHVFILLVYEGSKPM